MMPLLGFGEQKYPQLNEFFIQTPDKTKENYPSQKSCANNGKLQTPI